MSKSIIAEDHENVCHFCKRVGSMHEHHIFGGPNRKWSEKYGLKVHLCPLHHNMSNAGIHYNSEMMEVYHKLGQETFEQKYAEEHSCSTETARAEFMRIFGRNYIY